MLIVTKKKTAYIIMNITGSYYSTLQQWPLFYARYFYYALNCLCLSERGIAIKIIRYIGFDFIRPNARLLNFMCLLTASTELRTVLRKITVRTNCPYNSEMIDKEFSVIATTFSM